MLHLKKSLAAASAMAIAATPIVAEAAVDPTEGLQSRRQLDVPDFTDGGEQIMLNGMTFTGGPLVGIFWDERCASVEYTVNTTVDFPNVFEGPVPIEEAAVIMQRSFDRWNDNPAAYIEMNITMLADLGARPIIQGDLINELTAFTDPTFGALASSPSVALMEDTTFTVGQDINGDSVADVFDPAVEGRNTCFKGDDGMTKFPAGFYKAGTILENDVQFSSLTDWEAQPSVFDADIDAVATHEFGHSHGQAHTPLNQISTKSGDDGTGTTMYPFIDTSDPQDEFGVRSLHVDDLALSAFIYPEGSADSGIAALQPGDEWFGNVYDILEGDVNFRDRGVIGAYVSAVDGETHERVSGVLSGTLSRVFLSDAGFVAADEADVLNGRYALTVPAARNYKVFIEALDGTPILGNRISLLGVAGLIIGDIDFEEEGQNGGGERFIERNPGSATQYFSRSTNDIDFRVNEETVVDSIAVNSFAGFGFTDIIQPATQGGLDIAYAQRLDYNAVASALNAGLEPVAANFLTESLFSASLVPTYSRIKLAVGEFDPFAGTATINKVLRHEEDFFGEQNDYAPFYLEGPSGLTRQIQRELKRNPDADLFLVLELDAEDAFIGTGFGDLVNGTGPHWVGVGFTFASDGFFRIGDSGPFTLAGGGAFGYATQLRFIDSGRPPTRSLRLDLRP